MLHSFIDHCEQLNTMCARIYFPPFNVSGTGFAGVFRFYFFRFFFTFSAILCGIRNVGVLLLLAIQRRHRHGVFLNRKRSYCAVNLFQFFFFFFERKFL